MPVDRHGGVYRQTVIAGWERKPFARLLLFKLSLDIQTAVLIGYLKHLFQSGEPMADMDDPDQTRDRILQAALEIFAERGFKDATVRDICAQAGVNVASVNYYFRSKAALYQEALVYSFKEADRKYPQRALADDSLSPEDRLQLFIRSLLMRLMDDSHLGFHAKLMAREIADPTSALDYIVETVMRPRFLVLRDIIPRLAGPHWSPADIDRFIQGIIGQCLVYRHSRPMIERLCPDIIAGTDAIERSAEMIFQFSLAALQGLRETRP
jgi:AcrR family transcriptional regulator